MKELDQRRAESRAWEYFRVMLPVSREKFKERYKQASDRMRPGVHPGNTKGEFMEMRDFYHELLEANPQWAFTAYESRPRRPNRGGTRKGFKPRHTGGRVSEPLMKAFSVLLPKQGESAERVRK